MTQCYEIRKQWEATIQDISNLFQFKKKDFRESLKWWLIREGYMKSSTTELGDEQFKKFADQLTTFHARMAEMPPERRGVLEFKNIFSD